MTAEQSHRFALTGHDPEGRNRTVILWRQADLIEGKVVRRVVVSLDATMATATMFTPAEAVEVAEAMLAASPGVHRTRTPVGHRLSNPLDSGSRWPTGSK